MAMTPTLAVAAGGSSGTTHTTATFSPTANSMLYCWGTSRGTVTPGGVTPTTSGLTWNYENGVWTTGGSPFISITAWYALVGSSPPTNITVQGVDSLAAKVAIVVLQITNSFRGAALNGGAIEDAAGDPWPDQGSPPAATSCMLGCYAAAGTAAVTSPTGYTPLADFAAGTDLRTQVCYDDGSAAQAAQWVTTNTRAAAFILEIGPAAAAASALQHVSVTTW